MKVQTENKSFQRDIHSKALLMSNRKEVDEYKLKSKMLKESKAREEELNIIKAKVSEIDGIKEQLNEITNLLKGLAGK